VSKTTSQSTTHKHQGKNHKNQKRKRRR